MTASPPRLRFAPSPTGYLHVGGARTALFNWLLARKLGGQFLLRVEDTDRARSTEESTRAIFEGMTWLGLDWDEEVVFQGANLARHRADAERLLLEGKAYRCFCTADDLAQRRAAAEAAGGAFAYDRRCDRILPEEAERRAAAGEAFTIRFRVRDGETAWDDLVHGRISFPNKDIDDFIILRSDGSPIYNHAVVSDDIAMRISIVMRGDDHISNTPKQILLYEALGAAQPQFAHLPMIHGTDGKKLSKRHGATAVGDYQHQGILPQAMVNFLALLGWSPGGDFDEVMSMAQLVESFSGDGLLKKAAVFDPAKLEWMNGQHLARMPIGDVVALVSPLLVKAGLATATELAGKRAWLEKLLELLRVRARLTDEIVTQAYAYFKDDFAYEPDAVAKQWKDAAAATGHLAAAREALVSLEPFDESSIEVAMRALAESRGVGAGKLLQPLRVALVGSAASPGIFEVMVLLGREACVSRIARAVSYLAATNA
ncbi:MAG: glutamate--tRNA ligase [Gemmatimonadaceae bacterium]|nr:glutamate--tRNA ligase [Gemmatimonadaceae bacterium]